MVCRNYCSFAQEKVEVKKGARLMNLHLFEKHPPCNQCNRNLPFPTAEFGGFGHERRTGRAGGARRDALSGQAGLEGLAGPLGIHRGRTRWHPRARAAGQWHLYQNGFPAVGSAAGRDSTVAAFVCLAFVVSQRH